MKNYKKYSVLSIAVLLFSGCFLSCKEEKKKPAAPVAEEAKKELSFTSKKIVDSVAHVWAYVPSDLTGDGIVDVVLIDNNDSGGHLAYFKGQKEEGLWQLNVIAEKAPNGSLFAGGDLETADIDGDGDQDVIGIAHPGEWVDAGATAELFWYENDGGNWLPHAIGSVPDAVKDVSFADFDNDGKMDLSVLTFDEHTLSIFKQNDKDEWSRSQFISNQALHEGMGVGDIDGDGYIDIVATAFAYYNPGKDITQPWREENIEPKLNDQDGDWSRNGTKTFLWDIDGDGRAEVYLAHSERAGYPVALYQKEEDSWKSSVIKDSIPACHTLQVFDFDLDGDYDVLAGVNKDRAVSLDTDNFEVTVFLNDGDDTNYSPMELEYQGIYNGQALDYDGDGDIDIFRYPGHEATEFFILENEMNP
ncbi:MAG: VCBS repeat-containing protein [Pricia sp.]